MKTAQPTRIRIAAAVAVALLASANEASAAESLFAADVGVGSSDNILRTAANERSETITQVGVQFAVSEKSARLTADLRGDLAYIDYAGNTWASELIGNAGLAAQLGLVEDSLSWSLEDVFGQTRRDPFAAVTPLNRENVNYLSTGPNLTVRLDSTDRITAKARYGRVDFQTSLYNTDRYSAEAGYEHDLSAGSKIGLGASQERVDPQGSSLFSGYNHQEAYGRYAFDGARTKASLDVGADRVDHHGVTESGLLVRFDLVRKVDEISTVTLRAGRQTSDAGGSLGWTGGTELPTQGMDTQSLARTVNPFTSTYGQLGWVLAGRRTHLALGVGLYDESYADAPALDRKYYSLNLRADRALTPRLTARAGFAYYKYDYSALASDNDEKTFDLGVNWKLGRHVSLDLSAQKSSYSSQRAAGNVDETRVWLKLRYATNPSSSR